MINNPLDIRVNLRVFGVAKVLLKFGYAISQLKNLENRGRRQKRGAKIHNQSQNQERKKRRKNKYIYCLACKIKPLVSGNTR